MKKSKFVPSPTQYTNTVNLTMLKETYRKNYQAYVSYFYQKVAQQYNNYQMGYCVLFNSKLMARVRVRFKVRLMGCCSPVFVEVSVVIGRDPEETWRPEIAIKKKKRHITSVGFRIGIWPL